MDKLTESKIRTQADLLAAQQGYYFDPTDSERVQLFSETFCRLQDGQFAGQPLKFLPWVVRDIIEPLYGWKRPDGTRRFRRGSIWCCRKVAKTTSLAVLSLYQLLEEPAAQVYVCSSAIDSAKHLFNIAADFVEDNPTLSKLFWVRRNIKTIECKATKGVFRVLSGSKIAKSGHNSSCVFFDELAEIQSEEAWQRLYNSGKSRREPLWLSISTPQYDRNSLAWGEYKKALGIQSGNNLDLEYLGVVHGVPDAIDWKNPENWWQYLDPLGVDHDYYLREYANAKQNPRDLARFRNHLLCQWTDNLEGWLPFENVERMRTKIDLDKLKKARCYLGIDGSISNLSAVVMYFPDQQIAVPYLFIPRESASKSDQQLNTTWIADSKEGHITITEGNLFDWNAHLNLLVKLCKEFRVEQVAFDPYSLESRLSELQNTLPCPIIAVPPTSNHVAAPTKYLERMVLSDSLKISDNPCFAKNFHCASVRTDAHDRITLDRDKSSGRYDGVAALILAIKAYLDNQGTDSIYNSRGITL